MGASANAMDTRRGDMTLLERLVATTEFRTVRFPGARKDDIGGRFPGLRLRGFCVPSRSGRGVSREIGLRRTASVASTQYLAVHSCGDSHSLYCVPF
jgi:hypothetical protein